MKSIFTAVHRHFLRMFLRHHRCAWLTASILMAFCLIPSDPARDCRAEEPTDPQRDSARTSDGVDLAIWYYPAATDEAAATVIVVHALGGSHVSLEPLAQGLQAAGMCVVVTDLRGHGESTNREWPTGRTDTLEADRLLKADLEAVAASQGGRVREQARLRGDLEAVYGWIRKTSRSDTRLDPRRLCIVGSGLGGTLATRWTAADANWPPLASGPQGGNVRALCLISPVFAVKGVTIGPALQHQTVSRELPLLILSGEEDRDASRVFGQLKRARPDAWYEKKTDGSIEKATNVENPTTDASLFLLSYSTEEAADGLATAGVQTFVPLLADFFTKQLAR